MRFYSQLSRMNCQTFSLLQRGMTMPAALPSAGQIAPNSHAEECR